MGNKRRRNDSIPHDLTKIRERHVVSANTRGISILFTRILNIQATSSSSVPVKREEHSGDMASPERLIVPSNPPEPVEQRKDMSNSVASPHPAEETNDGDEPEFEPDYADSNEIYFSEFPITHELTLKDHTKVVSALALDPSGARVISGSHDYDCKLWDFGGMDMRCKPFKTWEPAGSYYVRRLSLQAHDDPYCDSDSRPKIFFGWT